MSIIKSGIIVGFFTFLSRIFGFVRDIFITKELGATIYSDAFNIAFRLPNLFRRIFAEGAFNSAFVPIFANKLKNNKDESMIFAGQALVFLTLVLFILILVLEIFLPQVLYLIAPGWAETDIETFELTINLSRIALPYLFFISLVSLIGGMLNSADKYVSAALSPVLLNISMIIWLVFFGHITKTKAHALVWGVFFGGIFQLLLIAIAAKRCNLLPMPQKLIFSPEIKKLFKNMVPGIIGGGITQINLLVSQALASFLPIGSLSILAYSDRVCQLPLAMIGTAIGTVILPTLSKQLNLNQKSEANYTQNRAVEIGFLFSLPSMCALIFMAEPIIFALFERGEFKHSDTILTTNCLIAFSSGLAGYIMIKIFSPSFFANYDTKTPVKISLICMVINFILTILLMEIMGVTGVAYATSISSILNAYILYRILKKRNLYQVDVKLKKSIIKIIISCMIMMLTVACYRNFFSDSLFHSASTYRLLSLTGLVSSGIITYFIAIHYFGLLTFKEIKNLFKKNVKSN